MRTQPLSEMHLAFLRALFQLGEASAADLRDALAGDGRSLAITTVATVLSRLEKKGYVAHRARGRQFVYRPTLTPEAMGESVVERITRALYGGNVAQLLAHLIDSDAVSADELREVKRMIEERERKRDRAR